MSRFKIILPIVIIALFLATSAVAWVGPPAGTPPACPAGAVGCDAPINVGGKAQIKSGTLKAGGLYLDAGKLLDFGNNLSSSDRIIGPNTTSGSIYYYHTSQSDYLGIIGGGKISGKRLVIIADNLGVPNGTTTSKNLDVLQISSLGSSGGQTIIGGNTGIKARNVLEFASNLTAPTQRENNAGKITYGLGPSGQNWTTYDALHIVGGGITYPNRKVRIWDDLVTDRLCDPANANRCVNVADLITHLNPTTPPPPPPSAITHYKTYRITRVSSETTSADNNYYTVTVKDDSGSFRAVTSGDYSNFSTGIAYSGSIPNVWESYCHIGTNNINETINNVFFSSDVNNSIISNNCNPYTPSNDNDRDFILFKCRNGWTPYNAANTSPSCSSGTASGGTVSWDLVNSNLTFDAYSTCGDDAVTYGFSRLSSVEFTCQKTY